MKKIFGVIVTVFAVLGSVFALSACSGSEHTEHDFTGTWVITDPDYHWHVCQTEGCDETDEKVAHIWVADTDKTDVAATCIADGIHYLKCSECGAKKSTPIATHPNHDFTGAWVTTDPDYHWHECKTEGCSKTDEKVAHTWVEGDVITPPDEQTDGVTEIECSVCHAKSTKVTPATGHPKDDSKLIYADGGTTHWYGCAEHTDCGKKYDEEPHDYITHLDAEDKDATCKEDGYTVWQCECGAKERRTVSKTDEHNYEGQQYISDGESGHHQVCKVCGESSQTVEHTRVEYVTTVATFWTEGSKQVTCKHCEYSATETITRLQTANFANEFSMETNPNGSWSYGQVEYIWGSEANGNKEDFTFTAATGKNQGGDGWTIGNCEIKNGYINSANWATVAFTFTEDTVATVNFKFTGNSTNTGELNTFNCRIGVKNEGGTLYSNPVFMGGDNGLNVCSNLDEHGEGAEYSFKAGDTIYFMIEHVANWESGTLELTITRSGQTDAE